ncbi:GAF domain-containing protein [Noviherbaspirillum pedocola]|uniref:Excisionase family DNA-binding protein n=1 Tax=Noviherbaspirillum pedocola TaxID=2801341 RepID=A0A934SY32_9BURK|nr:GAF domain-containing protein [Noviherbaspirillum pedocola]MBK4735002.1 excisionase family DNA-binding protein [Noviherbaspirillum pedocola]
MQEPESNDDPILTTRGAAELLGVAVSTAQQWMESGMIPSWKTPGGHRRVRQSAVMALMRMSGAGNASLLDSDEFRLPTTPEYPVSADEAGRLKALAETGLIDSAPERTFDRLTWLASHIVGTPMAMVSLLTARRQWFKSRVGLQATETPRAWAFCSHAILSPSPFVVTDAMADRRFANNPLVTGAPCIRFYAGVSLMDRRGYRLGTLCVLDRQPRTLDDEQLRALTELAAIAGEEIRRRAKP